MKRFRALLSKVGKKPDVIIAGLPSLAEELIQEIIRYLRWPTDFYSLSLVSRMFHRHATPELYGTLVIAYHRPKRINALLALLEKDSERNRHVKILLFDEDVKSIGPSMIIREKWPGNATRRGLTDGWDPASPDLQTTYPHASLHVEVSRRLCNVLRMLPNLQTVIMRSLHPAYMYPSAWNDANPGTPAIIKTIPHAMDIFSVQASGGVWEYLFDRSHRITSIFVNGVPRGRLKAVDFSVLTTICISDIYYHVRGHVDAAQLWHDTLSTAFNLQTMAMVQVEFAAKILEDLSFSNLQALELYMVNLATPESKGSPVFLDFLYRHSPTLHILALSCAMWGNVDHLRWLSDPNILPELHTLRLNHAASLLIKSDELVASASTNGAFELMEADRTEILFDFIKHWPKILDIGIEPIKRPKADKFAQLLTSTRRMRNVFIGGKAAQSLFNSTMTEQWGYSYQAWAFYELFGGLTITQSGYRPRLPLPPWRLWT